MPADSGTSPFAPWWRLEFRFSLRGLFVFTVGVAAGLAVARLPFRSWDDALLACLSAWFVLGLLNQVRDLWAMYHGRRDLKADERSGWRFAAGWRLLIAALIVLYYLLDGALQSMELAGGPVRWLSQLDWVDRSNVRDLCLVVVVASVPWLAQGRVPRSPWGVFVRVVSLAFGIPLAVCVLANTALIHYLVYLAITGLEMESPLHLAPEGIGIDVRARAARFLMWTILALVPIATNVSLTWKLVRVTTRGQQRHWPVLGGLLASACLVTSYPVWCCLAGIHDLCPAMSAGISPPRWSTCVLGVVPLLILVTAAAQRFVQVTPDRPHSPVTNWRQRPKSYYHERPLVLHASAIVMTLVVTKVLILMLEGTSFDFYLLEMVAALLAEPRFYFELALLGFAWQAVIAIWRQGTPHVTQTPNLPLGSFGAVWVAVFATTVTALPVLAGLSFALWLTPWYRWL